jgi:hypothetical protein
LGHIRLGRLPKTLRWRQVVDLLGEAELDTPAIARATTFAAERRLQDVARDPVLTHAFWLLTRLTAAARRPDFAEELTELGVGTSVDEPILAFISRVSDAVRGEASTHPASGHFSELASLALRRTLAETVGQYGPSLFGSSVDDLQVALRGFSSGQSFGRAARLFFGDFFARTLRSFVERELPNQTGPNQRPRTVENNQAFADSLDRYARESALIMESFAAGWYGKHNWESRGRISPEEAQGFVAVALRKLRMELTRAEP